MLSLLDHFSKKGIVEVFHEPEKETLNTQDRANILNAITNLTIAPHQKIPIIISAEAKNILQITSEHIN